MPKDLIYVSPAWLYAGQKMTVCYDFPVEPPPSSTQLEITFNPPSGSMSVTLYPLSPCVEIDIPSTAISVVITDTTGFSNPWSSVIF